MSVTTDDIVEALKPSGIASPSAWATRAGLTPQLISQVRAGKKALTPAARARLAEAANLPEAVVERLLVAGDER